MAAVENVEWLNQNLLRAYPLREDSDFVPLLPNGAKATGLRLPTCLISDFSFTLAFDDVDGTVPSLTGVSHAGGGFSFEISLGSAVLATKTVKLSEHTVNQAYALVGQGDNADCAGWLVVGDLARAAEELPEGVYRFAPGQVPFEVSTLRMAPRGVRSVTAVGKYGLKTYAPLYGNVRIVAGQDMSVRNVAGDNAIWLQAESKTGYERTRPCDCGGASASRVRSINGMTGEEFAIIGDGTCVSVEAVKDGAVTKLVKLADTCSTPCCGCAELNFVESAVATINRSLATLEGYAETLRARVAELQANQATTAAAVAAYPGVTIAAVRTALTHTVTLMANPNESLWPGASPHFDGGDLVKTASVECGKPYPGLPVPVATGYVFNGWYDAVDNAMVDTTQPVAITSDRTFWAQWTPTT